MGALATIAAVIGACVIGTCVIGMVFGKRPPGPATGDTTAVAADAAAAPATALPEQPDPVFAQYVQQSLRQSWCAPSRHGMDCSPDVAAIVNVTAGATTQGRVVRLVLGVGNDASGLELGQRACVAALFIANPPAPISEVHVTSVGGARLARGRNGTPTRRCVRADEPWWHAL